jgi:hypothetical protein
MPMALFKLAMEIRLLNQQLKAGKGSGTAQGIGRKAMAMEEGKCWI